MSMPTKDLERVLKQLNDGSGYNKNLSHVDVIEDEYTQTVVYSIDGISDYFLGIIYAKDSYNHFDKMSGIKFLKKGEKVVTTYLEI